METAIKIIKADKVKAYIEKPSKYEQDFPKEETKQDVEKNNNTEDKKDTSVKQEK